MGLGLGLIAGGAWVIGYMLGGRRDKTPSLDPITIESTEKRRVLERVREQRVNSIRADSKAPVTAVNATWAHIVELDKQLIELAEEERMAREVASERRRDGDNDG